MNLNGEEYFYIRNAQGDIIGLCDKSGAEVVSYSYDSFGKLTPSKAEIDDVNDSDKNGITGSLATTVGIKNPYLYRGYRFDSEIGLYYLQSRYYNPSWGRFLNADAIIGSAGELLGHNVFAYCKNNYVNGKDPSGFKSVPEWAGEDWEYEEPNIIKKDYISPLTKGADVVKSLDKASVKFVTDLKDNKAVNTYINFEIIAVSLIGGNYGGAVTMFGQTLTKGAITGAVAAFGLVIDANYLNGSIMDKYSYCRLWLGFYPIHSKLQQVTQTLYILGKTHEEIIYLDNKYNEWMGPSANVNSVNRIDRFR